MKITEEKWNGIIECYYDSMKSSRHCSIATVSESGDPNITPIGSLILTDNNSGYFFDTFTKTFSNNIDNNNKVCLMFVNAGKMFWLKSLYKNKFSKPSGIKLTGTVGEKRKATEEEIESFRNVIKPLKKFRGYHTLWDRLEYVRDIEFNEYYPVNTGKMTADL